MILDKKSPIPLYHQLSEHIKDQIESGIIVCGDKLPSEAEMIKRYDVARMTVRDALARLVNMGYLAKEHGRGTFCTYFPENVASKKRLDIDVILNMNDEYFIHYYVKGISNVLSSHDCNFIISDSNNDSHHICKLLKDIAEKGSSGVIVQPSHVISTSEDELSNIFTLLRRRNIPCVMINDLYECVEGPSYLALDEYAGGAMAAKHLIQLGHQRTGVVFIDNYRVFMSRRDGFVDEYNKMGMLSPIEIPTANENDFEEAFIRSVVGGKLTAAFCASDNLARLCADYLANLGMQIPDDFSLVGYDDSLVAEMMIPKLTSVAHPKQELGEMTAHALVDIIQQKERAKSFVHVFSPELTIRESTRIIK